MRQTRIGSLAYGLRHLRRAPDMAALRAASSPAELARLALIPAGRNLGISVSFLPAHLRAEATAALLACRVLDAFEDLSDRAVASSAVLAAADYLNSTSDTPPPALPTVTAEARDSEAVDRLLAERIGDIRALLSALSAEGQKRVGEVITDVAGVMARNIDGPLSRVAYSEGVLGRVTHYACALVAENVLSEADLRELTGCVAVIAQSANDLRDNEFEIYGVADREELKRMVMLQLLAPALGGFALLARLGPGTPSRGARAAMAYMTITTSAFLCSVVDAPSPYRRKVGAALLAASSSRYWTRMIDRVRRTADLAIHRMLDASPDFADGASRTREVLGAGDPATMATSLVPLIVDTTFALVQTLPEAPLTGELPDAEVRTMMIADHLAFGAMERVPPHEPEALQALATRLQLAALDTSTQGSRP
ncbi:hypothetical protein ATM97_25620 [Nocardia sp. MH4]|uniref:hypothetical protein n=1 Tax=Nocardia sp. MH4 TaxID=1768677 RepID=UPI001C50181B|nr:hypothetical protein [Nocardia sp. MH4]MBW0273461.1 hypothetical protein [Nocardia sp. MH4]